MSPQSVGVPAQVARVGKHSGTNALRLSLRDLGYEASDEELAEVYKRVTALGDQSKMCGRRYCGHRACGDSAENGGDGGGDDAGGLTGLPQRVSGTLWR